MEFLIEFLLEVGLQLLFELAALIFDGKFDLSERSRRRTARFSLYVVVGVVSGFISSVIFPYSLFGTPPHPLVSLLVLPITVGAVGALFAKWGERKFAWEVAGSNFLYSATLAFVFSLTRFLVLP